MPSQNLKIALLPHDIIEGDNSSNLKAVGERLKLIDSDTDLVVFPEMFNSGFFNNRDALLKIAEENNGSTITSVREWCQRYGFAIWGGFTAKEDGELFNRGFMCNPDGTISFYDKRHLFRSGGEHNLLAGGKTIAPIINYKTWNLKMAICYDIRFPIWNRNIANNYDALIVPANWPHSRVFAWKHLLIARAIENQVYVAGCNREGSDQFGDYPSGDSFIFNCWGDDIAERRADGIIYGHFDYKIFLHYRDKFQPWLDADKFSIKI
ncbi:MAG: nitrilase family protein [Paramuribaculum sp.]|nr:nitrilase family protein [Paramuribaculum sp.]